MTIITNDILKKQLNITKGYPENTGLRWTKLQKDKLVQQCKNRDSIEYIIKDQKRSIAGILSKLTNLFRELNVNSIDEFIGKYPQFDNTEYIKIMRKY